MRFLRRLIDHARGAATPAVRPRLAAPFEPVSPFQRMMPRQRDGFDPFIDRNARMDDLPASPQAEPGARPDQPDAWATHLHTRRGHEEPRTAARAGWPRAALGTPPEVQPRVLRRTDRAAAPPPQTGHAAIGEDAGVRPRTARTAPYDADTVAVEPREVAAAHATGRGHLAAPALASPPQRNADALGASAGSPTTAASATSATSARSATNATSTDAAPPPARRAVAVDPARIRPAPVVPRPATPPRARQPGDTAEEDDAPVIRITIGRIDVRAVSDASRQPEPRRRPDPPRLGIDEYLRQRMRGER
jgi:hypothetical protein